MLPSGLHRAGLREQILLAFDRDKARLHDALAVEVVLLAVDLGPAGLIALFGHIVPFIVLLDPSELDSLLGSLFLRSVFIGGGRFLHRNSLDCTDLLRGYAG